MTDIKDLTIAEMQGYDGHDQIDVLTMPGKYRIPIRTYNDKKGEHHRSIPVEIVSVFVDQGVQIIIVPDKTHDYYYVFYYNGNEKCFKPNWVLNEKYDKILSMINIEVELDKYGNVVNK